VHYVLFIGALLAVQLNIWAVPFFVVLCASSWVCAVIIHNTVHCSVFKNRRLNKLFQVALTVSYGHPVIAYVVGHNVSHHKCTQTERDVSRTTKVRHCWDLLNDLLFLPTVSGSILKNDGVL
jgi:fatty acid desaturase